MAVNAYVLPHPGGAVGVVFWDVRPAPRRAGAGGAPDAQPGAAGGDEFAVYAPRVTVPGAPGVSPGEVAELQAHYVASLGGALSEADRAAAVAPPLALWWLAGVAAAALLAARALEYGPAYTWLALVAAVSALPVGALGARRLGARRARLARRLARRASALQPVAGAEPRLQERLDALWQAGRRLRGAEGDQLRQLEAWCREHAWRQAERFYADQRRRRAAGGAPAGAPLARLRAGLRLDGNSPYSLMEMRDW